MKFECGDLDRALAVPELMPEIREHLKHCADCRRQYHLWTEISSLAKGLHEEWDSPGLWPAIREELKAGKPAAPRWWANWQTWTIAAALLVAAFVTPFLWHRAAPLPPAASARLGQQSQGDQDFLTERALLEVEKNEAAYRQSIEKLSRLAEPKMKNATSPRMMNEHEKLLTLDSAIAETRSTVAANRFNIHLQRTLAELYREKQRTLQELLAHEQKN